MSQVLEAGCSYDTPPPPTPFTGVYAESPRSIDEMEHLQSTPRWIDLDPLTLVGVTQEQKQEQPQPKLQPQLQRLEQGNLVRWYPVGTAAIEPSQTLREETTRRESASRHCSRDLTSGPACVDIHLMHSVATPTDLSRAINGPSALGCGSQPPYGIATIGATSQRLHGCVHQAATRSWSPPMRRTPAVTPPPPWVQPRLSATPQKAVYAPTSATTRQQPVGKRLSVATPAAPAGFATFPSYAKLPGPPDQRAWQPNNSQAPRWQRVEAWPLVPATTTEIQQKPMLLPQVSGSAVISGQGIPSQTLAVGQHVLGQLQGQLHGPTSCVRMLSPRRGIASKADLLDADWEAPNDESVRKHTAMLCTPSLSSRKVRSCCSPSLQP
mmetsp:Transcript_119079/g.237478  ORF Transcript_119079/g.237478 Transcript_119079/m.237478 type:complete len:381 (+) Transcript_119079:63-1205(+)